MSWPAAIVGAIHHSRVMVLVFSSHAIASDEVQREVVHAFQNGVAVIPLRIEDVRPTGDMAYYMSSTHWLDAITEPLAAHLRTLCQTVQAILSTVRQRQAAPAGSFLTPATPEVAGAGAVASGSVNSGTVNSGTVNSSTVNSDSVNADSVNSDVVNSDLVNSDPVNAVEPAPVRQARLRQASERAAPGPPTAARQASAPQASAPTNPAAQVAAPTNAAPHIQMAERSAATSGEVWPSRPGRVWPWPSPGVLRERRYARGLAATAVALAAIAAITAEALTSFDFLHARLFCYVCCFLFALFPLAGAFASLRWGATSAWRACLLGVVCAFAAYAVGYTAIISLLALIRGQPGDDKLWRLTMIALWCGIAPCVTVGLSWAFLMTARRPDLGSGN